MQPLAAPLIIGLVALVAGIVIDRIALPHSSVTPTASSAARISSGSPLSTSTAGTNSTKKNASTESGTPDGADDSKTQQTAQSAIAAIKLALANPNSRRNYGRLSKVIDALEKKELQEVIKFAEGLPKQQEKSMLVSMLVSRWAEFDPQAAIAYAQAAKAGSNERNWAVTTS